MKEASLGKVPSAGAADTATTAEGLSPLTVLPLSLDPTWAADLTSQPFYTVDSQGLVRLQGAVMRTSGSGNLIGTLPVGARPSAPAYGVVVTLTFTIGVIGIATNGEVRLQSGNPGYVSLDNVTFLMQ